MSNPKERQEFRKIGIAILILGTVIDTLALVLAFQIELGFLFLLIPGTCYIVNSSILLILDEIQPQQSDGQTPNDAARREQKLEDYV